MRVLITGISGFVGSYLAEHILKAGAEVYGTTRPRSNLENISGIKKELKLVDCNILDAISVMKTIKEVKPDIIHHLAAQSFVPTSWKSPQDTLQTNIIGTVNVLEAVREYCPACTIHIAGSSEEYGIVLPDEVPIKETAPLRPLSPYGISKVTQDLLGQQYSRSYGLRVVVTRAFNHEGARRGEFFITSTIAKQLAEIEQNKRSILLIGNTDAVRDFTDVKDVIRAYWMLVNRQGEDLCEVFNICSGVGTKISSLLIMFTNLSCTDEYEIRSDKERMRPSDVPLLIGDNTKIREAIGWKPEIPLEETVQNILDYYREKIK